MPLKSQSQRRYLWATDPELAQRFEDHTPKGTSLPERAKTAGASAALEYYGVKQAFAIPGMGGVLGKAVGWGGKALGMGSKLLGTLPTGVGNVASAGLGAIGGGMQALAQGEGMKGVALRGSAGALGGIPGGAGFAASTAAGLAADQALKKPPLPMRIPGT